MLWDSTQWRGRRRIRRRRRIKVGIFNCESTLRRKLLLLERCKNRDPSLCVWPLGQTYVSCQNIYTLLDSADFLCIYRLKVVFHHEVMLLSCPIYSSRKVFAEREWLCWLTDYTCDCSSALVVCTSCTHCKSRLSSHYVHMIWALTAHSHTKSVGMVLNRKPHTQYVPKLVQ